MRASRCRRSRPVLRRGVQRRTRAAQILDLEFDRTARWEAATAAGGQAGVRHEKSIWVRCCGADRRHRPDLEFRRHGALVGGGGRPTRWASRCSVEVRGWCSAPTSSACVTWSFDGTARLWMASRRAAGRPARCSMKIWGAV